MCVPALAPLFAGGAAAGAATAAGATAAAATAGQALVGVGTMLAVGGQVAQGIAGARDARAQAQMLEQQRQDEIRLASIEDGRIRERFRAELGRQRAELAARGISLDSPTAVLLGEEAAREASFASQSRQSEAASRSAELDATSRQLRARGRLSLMRGAVSGVGTLLQSAPDVWPGLLQGGAG